MKAFLTLILILFFGAISLAQKESTNAKVEIYKMDLVLDTGAVSIIYSEQTQATIKNDLARVYKFKNSRIKKELAFTTKNNRPKLA